MKDKSGFMSVLELVTGRDWVCAPGVLSEGGDGSWPLCCCCTSRARSIKEAIKTFVKPLMVVMTEGGTDWDRVWFAI